MLRVGNNRLKLLELRDKDTFIPVAAIDCTVNSSDNTYDTFLLRKAGYGSNRLILLTRLDGGKSCYDYHNWDNPRTWGIAHKYIEEHWDEITDSDVIDVEFILGETTEKKVSDRYYGVGGDGY